MSKYLERRAEEGRGKGFREQPGQAAAIDPEDT